MRRTAAALLLSLPAGLAGAGEARASSPSSSPASPSPSSSPAAPAAPAVARVVVVVGHNGGAPDPRPPLTYADDDAARLFLQLAPTADRAWLLTTFDRDSARAFPDLSEVARPPTKEALAGALGEAFWLLRQKKARGEATELVFAFAGHGDVDDAGRGFVVLADGGFTRDDLARQVLEPSPADLNHVVVDACSSYFFVKSRGGAPSSSSSVPLTPQLLDVLRPQGTDFVDAAVRARTGVLVSTSTAAEVHESSALGAGVFSYLLRSALTGVADVDGNGRVEYVETAAFVAGAQSALDDPRARLSIHAEPPLQRPHAALVDLARSGATAFLAVDERRPVRLRVLDPRGTPYAEVNAAGDKPVFMALRGQPFFLVQRDGEEAVLVPRNAGAYALSTLDFAPSPHARGGGDDVAGEDPARGPFARLFQRPLDRGFVDGFLSSSSLAPPAGGVAFSPAWSVTGAPPARVPVDVVGGVVLGGAALAGAGAVGALVGNQLAFGALQQTFATTGQIDPAQSLAVEGWRNAATALTLGAVGLGLAGGGLVLWSFSLPDGEVALP
jgi:hypothetical protein